MSRRPGGVARLALGLLTLPVPRGLQRRWSVVVFVAAVSLAAPAAPT